MREHALLRALVESIPDACWVVGTDGAPVLANRAMADLLGAAGPEELEGLRLDDVLDEEARTRIDAGDPEADHDVYLRRRDGTRRWARVAARPLTAPELPPLVVHRFVALTGAEARFAELVVMDQRTRALHTLARTGTWEWDPRTDEVRWSCEIAALLEIRPDLMPPTWSATLALIHPEDRDEVRAVVEAAARGEADLRWRARLGRPGEAEVWLSTIGVVNRDADGEAVSVYGVTADVTRAMLDARAASAAHERVRLLQRISDAANQSHGLLEALGRAGRLLAANSTWHAVGVYVPRPDGPLDALDFQGTRQNDHPVSPAPALARQSRETGEIVVAPVPGDEDRRSNVLVPVSGDDATVCVIQVVADEPIPLDAISMALVRQIRDQLERVHEREQAAIRLAEARDAAMQASRLKSEFLATMSHEIRTPMNGVIGLTDLLDRTDLDPQQRRLHHALRSSGLTLLGILNDILDLSKIESGRLELEVEDFEPRALLDQTVAVLAGPALERDLELVVGCDPDVPRLLRGDAVRLGQIVNNLGSNAVRFTDEGEVVIRMSMDPGDAATVVISVRDTGVGIAAEDQERLFEAFSQADPSTTRRHGGTGLGLAICRRLAHLHGGSLEVESAPGEGSTFTARLPLAVAERSEGPSLPPPLEGVRVLVVDDTRSTADLLTQQLRGWGARATAVASADQAVGLARQGQADAEPIHVALVDLTLAGGDALTLGRRLRGDDQAAAPDLHLVLMSADPDLSVERAREAGFGDTIHKPLRTSELYDALLSRAGARPPSPTSQFGPQLDLKVLVVEDNPVNQLVTAGLAESLGCAVAVATNGVEAVELLTTAHPFDVVLMDCRMPVLDGYDATLAIRAAETQGRVPIIAMTASALAGERERCLAVGMDDFLTKPIDIRRLARLLARWSEAAPAAVTGEPEPDLDPPETVTEHPVLDADQVAQLGGLVKDGVSFFERSRMAFLARIDAELDDVDAALARADLDGVVEVAHRIAGSAANVGLARAGDVARRVEELARERGARLPTTSLTDAASHLRATVEEGVEALAAISMPSTRH